MITIPHNSWSISTAVTCLLLVGGCSSTLKVAVPTYAEYPQRRAHPMTITLHVTEEYSGYVYAKHYPLGDALERNSVAIVERIFDEVHVAKGSDAEISENSTGVLTPKVTFVDMSTGVSIFDKIDFVIDVEWVLQDARGNTLWMKTIRGKGRNTMDSVLSGVSHFEDRVRMGLENLFTNSYEAMSTSPLIHALGQDQ